MSCRLWMGMSLLFHKMFKEKHKKGSSSMKNLQTLKLHTSWLLGGHWKYKWRNIFVLDRIMELYNWCFTIINLWGHGQLHGMGKVGQSKTFESNSKWIIQRWSTTFVIKSPSEHGCYLWKFCSISSHEHLQINLIHIIIYVHFDKNNFMK
jgi:hypothetical protein